MCSQPDKDASVHRAILSWGCRKGARSWRAAGAVQRLRLSLRTSGSGTFLSLNLAGARYWGCDRREILGRNCLCICPRKANFPVKDSQLLLGTTLVWRSRFASEIIFSLKEEGTSQSLFCRNQHTPSLGSVETFCSLLQSLIPPGLWESCWGWSAG